MKIYEFQGDNIIETPELPGIYAWYYRPRVLGDDEAKTLGRLIARPSSVKTEIAGRYGLMWAVDSDVDVLYGAERQPVNQVVSEAVVGGDDLMESFLQNLMVPYFAKPLYIGIDTKNLHRRINEHYDLLDQQSDPNAPVSKYLAAHPNATVEEVLKRFELPHSFAAEARIKGIAPRDLVVYVCPIKDSGRLRDLERILQILADPICGRS